MSRRAALYVRFAYDFIRSVHIPLLYGYTTAQDRKKESPKSRWIPTTFRTLYFI